MELVWNRSDYTLHIGQLTVIAAPPDYPPFKCEAMVEEQDTWLVLGKPVPVADTGPPLWYLSHTLDRAQPLEPGSVL
ncbi:MAG: hypothetical protein R3318_06410, partial [Gammaproteobacteria bacterium]|nr:hypothetical protein [Gammaproteobacteria bacterium]